MKTQTKERILQTIGTTTITILALITGILTGHIIK